MATNVSAQLMQSPEFAPQVQGLDRQRKMAEMLMTQGFQPQQGQMVSGHYVAPSWTQQLAGLANIWAGKGMQEEAEQKQLDLAKALRGKQQEAVQDYFGALQGTPGTQGQAPVIPEGQTLRDDNGMLTYGAKAGIAGTPGTGPNYTKAFQAATGEYAPSWLTGMAVKQLEPVKLGEGEQIMQRDFATGELKPVAGGGMKLAGKVNEAAQLLGITKPYKDWTREELNAVNQKVEDLTRKGASVSNTVVNTGQRGFTNILEMKNAFKNEPIYKAHQEVQSAYNQIDKSLKENTPIGDVAAATKIMKLLDPGSVVRESELGMAVGATGLGPKISNLADSIIKGQKLNPEQRKQFRTLANQFYNSSINQYNSKRKEYADVASQFEINPNLAVGSEYKPIDTSSNW